MPWWIPPFMCVLWAWGCFQTYRGVRYGRVRGRSSDASGRHNPLYWIYFGFYAFGAVFVPIMMALMFAKADAIWP